jgi:hypothetical protein
MNLAKSALIGGSAGVEGSGRMDRGNFPGRGELLQRAARRGWRRERAVGERHREPADADDRDDLERARAYDRRCDDRLRDQVRDARFSRPGGCREPIVPASYGTITPSDVGGVPRISAQVGGAQNIFNIGDDETPASVGDVPASFTLADLSLGFHSCVVTSNGDVRCWGDDSEGQLGRGKSADLMYPGGASDAVDVSLGASAQAVVVGDRFSCALTKQHSVRCWGTNDAGQLGYGHTMNIGDDEPPRCRRRYLTRRRRRATGRRRRPRLRIARIGGGTLLGPWFFRRPSGGRHAWLRESGQHWR